MTAVLLYNTKKGEARRGNVVRISPMFSAHAGRVALWVRGSGRCNCYLLAGMLVASRRYRVLSCMIISSYSCSTGDEL
jgi:hypothetical protein